MKAVILAAGEGRRLRPLTELRPKPMLPVANQPLLEHVVTAVADAGIDEIVLVVGYRRERIQSYFDNGQQWDVDITYAVQEDQLGTGHALCQAEPYVGEDFVALNGDRIIETRLVERVVETRRDTGEMAVAITEAAEPSNYGVVELDGDRLVGIRERPPPSLVTSNLINAGVYAFGPDVFTAIRETDVRGELGLPDALSTVLDDRPIHAVRSAGHWLDVSKPWDLITVNERVGARADGSLPTNATIHSTAVLAESAIVGEGSTIHPNATVLQGATVGANVSVDPNAVIANTVILPDATIGAGVLLQDCIVGANTEIGPGTVIEGGSADVVLGDEVHRDVTFGGMIGDNAALGGNVTVTPGTILGNGVTVESGATVSGRVESETVVTKG